MKKRAIPPPIFYSTKPTRSYIALPVWDHDQVSTNILHCDNKVSMFDRKGLKKE